MVDKSQIPYLLKLIDDDNPEIRLKISNELSSLGIGLEEEIAAQKIHLNESQNSLLNSIIIETRKSWLKKSWAVWQLLPNDYLRIEKANHLLSVFHYGVLQTLSLSELLDNLSYEYSTIYPLADEFSLADFLFGIKAIAGARDDYYNPLNSNLVYVIKEKNGIPLSLACIYMLVGHRLGLRIEGCNYPSHFLTRFFSEGQMIFVDCFNDGKFVYEEDLIAMEKKTYFQNEKYFTEYVDANTIIMRTLNNLSNAYRHNNELELSSFFSILLNETPQII